MHIIVVNRDVDRNDALYGLVPVFEARTFFITFCNSPLTSKFCSLCSKELVHRRLLLSDYIP